MKRFIGGIYGHFIFTLFPLVLLVEIRDSWGKSHLIQTFLVQTTAQARVTGVTCYLVVVSHILLRIWFFLVDLWFYFAAVLVSECALSNKGDCSSELCYFGTLWMGNIYGDPCVCRALYWAPYIFILLNSHSKPQRQCGNPPCIVERKSCEACLSDTEIRVLCSTASKHTFHGSTN